MRDAVAATPTILYWLTRPKLDELLDEFEIVFESMEMRVWKELFLLYQTRINCNVVSDQAIVGVQRGFVVNVDEHFRELAGSGGGRGTTAGEVWFVNDSDHFASTFVLQGRFSLPQTDKVQRGPCVIPVEADHVIFHAAAAASSGGRKSVQQPRVMVIPTNSSFGVAEVKDKAKTIIMEDAKNLMKAELEDKVDDDDDVDGGGGVSDSWRSAREGGGGEGRGSSELENISSAELSDDIIAALRRTPEETWFELTAADSRMAEDSFVISLLKIRVRQVCRGFKERP